MKPIEFEGQTKLLGPPPAMRRGACGALPVLILEHPASGVEFRSCWRPSPEELSQLNAGCVVVLSVLSGAHPPVWLSVRKAVELP